jgi:CBS domain-containing protein
MAERVRDIMDANPIVVTPDADVEAVIRVLHEHELSGVPVVDGDNRCVGIVTEADLVLADEEGDLHLPHYIELFGGLVFVESMQRFERRVRKASAATARDMMSENPDTVTPDATIREAARLIVDRGHNRLPVVEDGRLVGVVTRVDVLGALAR